MDTLPWVEKHRPKKLDDISGQDEIISLLKSSIKTKTIPHMLLHGPPGSGKTTTVLAMARELYGNKFGERVLEMNASDERGINVVRDKIKVFAKGMISGDPPFKLIILDEADSMTDDAQSALRCIIEKSSEVTRFCLICNNYSKIIDPIISRCAIFRFKPLEAEPLKLRLDYICEKEKIKITEEAKNDILEISKGDLRSSVTLLQCASQFSQGDITSKQIYEISGTIPKEVKEKLWKTWEEGNFSIIQEEIVKITRQGYSASILLTQLCRDLLSDNKFSDNKRMDMFIVLSDAEKAMVDGADEQLQLLKVASRFLQIIKGD